ncbi:MAG: tRNA (adenosine(37)-N6)-threonylcarbamoyltransferase complex ATPase subunit type 1 TsaE [Candidatus Omnitrophota bacterium]
MKPTSKTTEISESVEDTVMIGRRLAGKLRPGDVVALIGSLGAGKTVMTKGIAKGLGVRDTRYVNSPTFVLIKEYKARIPLYHFDLYRIDSSGLLDVESYEEYFYGPGVTVIEWADKVRDILPKRHIEVNISVMDSGRRKIEINRI